VVHLVSRPVRRGAQVYAAQLCEAIDDDREHVLVGLFGPEDDSPLPVDVSLDGTRRKLWRRVADPRAAWRLRRLLPNRPAAVIAYGGEAAACVAAAFPFGGPVLIYRKIGMSGANLSRLQFWWWRRVIRRFDLVVAVSRDAEQEAIFRYGVEPSRVRLIGNARDPDVFRPPPEPPPEPPVTVAFVGALNKDKRPDWVVESVCRLRSAGHDVRGLIIGSGPLEDKLRSATTDGIDLLGNREDVAVQLRRAHILAFPGSPLEGTPGVLIEAGLTGLPVVTTDLASAREVVVDGVTGVVVPDETSFHGAVARLAIDSEERQRLGTAARRYCAEVFGMPMVAQRWAALLDETQGERLRYGRTADGTAGLRVLHVVSRSQRRGAEIAALELAAELDALGHENRIVALAADTAGRVVTELPLLTHGDLGPTDRVHSALALRREVRAWQPAVVMAHGGTAAMVAVLACAATETRVVWQRILELSPGAVSGPAKRAWLAVARRIDAVVAITDHLADEMPELGFRGPIWRIPNTRRQARFADIDHEAARRGLRDELGIGPETALIGLVGHLVEQKRPERAVASLEHLLRAGIDAHLVVVGDGPERRAVEDTVAKARLGKHVTLLGHRADIPDLLAGLDLLVVTSDSEAMTGTMIEAQMAGCPVVSYPLDGALDAIDQDRSGVVLRGADTGELALEVASLLRDTERLQSMSKRAMEHATSFATEVLVREYDARLRELVNGSRRRRARRR
jgi:glycosyltransferase involved in cell wall biosynthesis